MGKVCFIMGKVCFIMGKVCFIMGKVCFIMGKVCFIMGKVCFIMGKVYFSCTCQAAQRRALASRGGNVSLQGPLTFSDLHDFFPLHYYCIFLW